MENWKVAGLFIGLLIGAAPVLSASWTWAKKQILGMGGGSLLASGTIIVVVAVVAFGDWNLFRGRIKDGDWSLELQKARKEINDLRNELQLAQSSANTVKAELARIETEYGGVIELASSVPKAAEFRDIKKAIVEVPSIRSAVVDMGQAQLDFLGWGISVNKSMPEATGWKTAELENLRDRTKSVIEQFEKISSPKTMEKKTP